MYDKMGLDKDSHSLKKDLEKGTLKGYIGVCASFAMKMYARENAFEYFQYENKDGSMYMDSDPMYNDWKPKNKWDFKFLGRPTVMFDSCGVKDIRSYSDNGISPDLIQDITVPSGEDAFQDAVSFLNWLPLINLNDNNQPDENDANKQNLGFKVILIDDSDDNPKPGKGKNNEAYTMWGEGKRMPCFTSANEDTGTYYEAAITKASLSLVTLLIGLLSVNVL